VFYQPNQCRQWLKKFEAFIYNNLATMKFKIQPYQYIIIPLLVVTAFLVGLAYWFEDSRWATAAAMPFVAAAAIWVLSPQVNWLWWQRNPPPLDPAIEQFLASNCGYYQNLSPQLRQRFRTRVTLFMLGNDFIRPVPPDDPDAAAHRKRVPEDLKAAVSACAAQVFFGKTQFMTGKYENIILYPHPFPTPQHAAFHNSEIFDEDGVLLFNADPLMVGFQRPQSFFSIGLYEMARVFQKITPSVSTPNLDGKTMASLEQISGMSQNDIETIVGLPNLDGFGIAAHHFLVFPDRFKTVLPDLYQLLENIFEQNPANGEHPI
jgi:Mlc titration factor MtfA (ptsG expression regulator)